MKHPLTQHQAEDNSCVGAFFKKIEEKLITPKLTPTLSHIKRYSSPVADLEWPKGFQEVKVPRFHDNGTGWW